MIRNGVNMHGTISENEDTDYYCYIAEKSGKAILVFDCDGVGWSFGWNIEVYDNSKKKLHLFWKNAIKQEKAFR